MTTFKGAVQADIDNTFLNVSEFADWHDVNGEQVNCVVDKDILQERKSAGSSEFTPGVFQHQILVYVAAADLPRRPVRDELFRLDGDRYLVADCAENMGMLEVTLEANDT